ncbi:MAG: hypothetical protein WCE23_17320 [Candidatus Binatus sp.]|uniref:hypothetical protein n=1 Tax=Candidatus Binatus sp. TaxID=2811406 RepID=UPI003C719E9F
METTCAVITLGALAQEIRSDFFRVPAQVGLITVRREGRSLINNADDAGMNSLLVRLIENPCASDPGTCDNGTERGAQQAQ